MAILAALLTLGSRFAGKILTTALGWASTLLFGRVPADRQFLVLAVTFGSVIWMALIAGVLIPDIGTFLLVLVPSQDVIPEAVIRLIMLIGALIVPAVVGGLTLVLTNGERTVPSVATSIARGYPLTVLLAVLLVFLAGLGIFRKVQSLIKRWKEAHVPIVVRASAYDDVAADLVTALEAAGLAVTPRAASAVMSNPARWLSKVAGAGSASLVPERLIQLDGDDLDILIYPMDLLISGRPELVNRARAAMASRLTTTAAYLTITAEAQAIEDRLAVLGRQSVDDPGRRPRYDDAAAAAFAEIDASLAEAPVEYEEWEVLYRMRLQVERDLRAGAMAGENVVGAEGAVAPNGLEGVVSTVGRFIRGAVAVAVEAAADKDTGKALDAAAGSGWRWAARAADLAHVAARGALAGSDGTGRTSARGAATRALDPLLPDGVVSPGAPPAAPGPGRDPGTTTASQPS